ncbi:MAG: histidinol-phosphate aminotransferase [Gammaproteobacteria bacterium]|nr:histidinol-phosphate aminotransferase [Gammaproteobacteria bacterium]
MSIDKVTRWIRPSVLATSAYHVQNAAGLVKLDAMENPYTWPAEIKQSWLNCLADAEINRYPSADATVLKESLRTAFTIPADMELLLGNGSDEIIQIIMLAMAGQNTVFMAPTPTFVMYEVIAAATQARFVGIPLQRDFTLDTAALLRAIRDYQPAAIFLAYPNNPTGNLFDTRAIIDIIEHAPGIVVVDEAYHVFAESSFLDRLAHYDNLLIMRTMSKFGLAGLRLGFLAGPADWLREFDKIRLPYNINILTQLSTTFILDHIDLLNEQAAAIRHDREILCQALAAIPGIAVWPSATNFLLFRIEQGGGDRLFNGLKQAGVLIKNLHGSHPLLADCLRVTIGTPEQNQLFLEALTHISHHLT